MRKLTSVPLFSISNGSNRLTNAMLKIPNAAIVNNQVAPTVSIIERRFSYSLTTKVVENFNNGKIDLVASPDILVPTFIPSYLKATNKGIVATTNITEIAKIDRHNGNITVDPRMLFNYMQTATILLYLNSNFVELTNNGKIATLSAEIFSKLVCKILDKTFSINLSTYKADLCAFIAAKYFLIYHMERHEGSVNEIAFACTSGTTSKASLFNFDTDFDSELYHTGTEGLIELLRNVEGLNKLKHRFFVSQWLTMFKPKSLLALEYLPFFYHTIFNSMVGGEFAIENIAGTQINNLNNQLGKLIR